MNSLCKSNLTKIAHRISKALIKLKYNFSLPAIVYTYNKSFNLVTQFMDLRALKYFVAVVENGSFSAAAKVCYIAQPSISSAISQLESELKQQLFIRHTRGIEVTEHGDKLYPLAVQLLGQAAAIKQSFIKVQDKSTFLLGVTRGLGRKTHECVA